MIMVKCLGYIGFGTRLLLSLKVLYPPCEIYRSFRNKEHPINPDYTLSVRHNSINSIYPLKHQKVTHVQVPKRPWNPIYSNLANFYQIR